MAKVPDIEKLSSDRDEKKLIKALGFKSDPAIRSAAADALGGVGTTGALKTLIASFENDNEDPETRKAALFAVGKICTRFINDHNRTDPGSLSWGEKKRRNREAGEIEQARSALKRQMDNGSRELSIEAARAFMSLPMSESSVFSGESSESAFSFDTYSPEQPEENTDDGQPDVEEEEIPPEDQSEGTETPETSQDEIPAAEEQASEEPDTSAAEEEGAPSDEPEAETEKESSEPEPPTGEQPAETHAEPSPTDEEQTAERPVEGTDSSAGDIFSTGSSTEADLYEPVEIAPDTWRIGTSLESNIYLRIFRNGDRQLNLLIDPGSPVELTPLVEKLTALIGGIRNLHMLFLSSHEPDVAYNAAYIQKLNPGCAVISSENTWKLAWLYGLSQQSCKCVESFTNLTASLNTGHSIHFIPVPYCHTRGSTMLHDPQTGVLFSGDLLGSMPGSGELYATEDSWEDVEDFHKIWMPSRRAMRYAADEIERLQGKLNLVAPQHGSLIRSSLINGFLKKLDGLSVGMKLYLMEDTRQNYVHAMNEMLTEFSTIVDPDTVRNTMNSVLADHSLEDSVRRGTDGISSIRIDREHAMEIFLREMRNRLPAEKLDLVDACIVKTLTSWDIPLPAFFNGGENTATEIFS